eukprot:GILJ01001017.1.p1 GENE.GILJ01001017.1~~GILJ01001017.1.p1  ORF type:complete len:128 (+),score=3.18 GILJ01001017.1:211-594(+)
MSVAKASARAGAIFHLDGRFVECNDKFKLLFGDPLPSQTIFALIQSWQDLGRMYSAIRELTLPKEPKPKSEVIALSISAAPKRHAGIAGEIPKETIIRYQLLPLKSPETKAVTRIAIVIVATEPPIM